MLVSVQTKHTGPAASVHSLPAASRGAADEIKVSGGHLHSRRPQGSSGVLSDGQLHRQEASCPQQPLQFWEDAVGSSRLTSGTELKTGSSRPSEDACGMSSAEKPCCSWHLCVCQPKHRQPRGSRGICPQQQAWGNINERAACVINRSASNMVY